MVKENTIKAGKVFKNFEGKLFKILDITSNEYELFDSAIKIDCNIYFQDFRKAEFWKYENDGDVRIFLTRDGNLLNNKYIVYAGITDSNIYAISYNDFVGEVEPGVKRFEEAN